MLNFYISFLFYFIKLRQKKIITIINNLLIIHGRVTTTDKPVTEGLFRTSLNFRQLLQVVFVPSVTADSAVGSDVNDVTTPLL